MKELRTLTPFGLELVTIKEDLFGVFVSMVINKGITIYHYADIRCEYENYEQAHQAALSDFLRLAIDKDLSKPIN